MGRSNDKWRYIFFVIDISMLIIDIFHKLTSRGHRCLKKNKRIQHRHSGKTAYVFLNAPCLDLERSTYNQGNDIAFFVNRGYLHPLYKQIKPQYHVFIDSKFQTGEWSIAEIYNCIELNPEVTLILNSKWHKLPEFRALEEITNVVWIQADLLSPLWVRRSRNITKRVTGLAVFGACTYVAEYTGCSEIIVDGFSGNGFAFEMSNAKSHFYGSNSENRKSNAYDVYKDLYMNFWYMRSLERYSGYLPLKLQNISKETIMYMFDE